MDPLLHTPQALMDVATNAAEPAASWARSILCLWYPDRPTPLPTADLLWDPILAHHGVDAERLEFAVGRGPLTEGLAATIGAGRIWGHDLSALAPLLRRARASARPDAIAWLVHALPDPLTIEDVTAAAAQQDGAAQWLAPASVVRFISGRGGDGAATAQVFAKIPDSTIRFATLRALGLPPPTAEATSSIDQAVALGATRAGQTPPTPPRARGSRHRRAAAWANTLLQGRTDALSAGLLACLSIQNTPAMTRMLMAEASWLAHFAPTDDPIDDVIARGGSHHGPTMIAARNAATAADLDRLMNAAESGVVGAAILALKVSDELDPRLWTAAISRATAGASAPTWEAIACATAPGAPERVPQLLQDPALREVGLSIAAWCPTFEVLRSLLELPVPSDPRQRRTWAWALACTGDRVAAEHIQALAHADPELDLSLPKALSVALGL